MTQAVGQIDVKGEVLPGFADILTPEALEFVRQLHTRFNSTREGLLANRQKRQQDINAGHNPDFLPDTQSVRSGEWKVAAAPADLEDRRVEITGPVEAKMMINALNSGANVFMADLEDSLSPSWTNVIEGQINLKAAVRKTLTFESPEGKAYKLNQQLATLLVRPRGWHLLERHVLVGEAPVSASLFDFGLYFFHNAVELGKRNTGPYFYLPKMESHLEARLWNDVFNFAQDYLKIPQGTIRATVLIETILASFEMEEILFELKDHMSGLNAGRWDYIFSAIKKFSSRPEFLFPDRAQVTMRVPFMRAYCQLLVKTCHKRGAHAMGGMAAFIPSRRDPQINENALSKVRDDKELEVSTGFDGTWVAHPDLVPVAKEVFDKTLGEQPNQKSKQLPVLNVSAKELLDVSIDGGKITEAGVSNNINVALQYIESWLRGTGAAAIHNLMEDAATAEISRAQLWQWIKNEAKLDDGRVMTLDLYYEIQDKELDSLTAGGAGRFHEAAEILHTLVVSDQFIEFLTVVAYEYLNRK
ncbi:MAG: malate synthase A [Candidatus Obscuribacterales bacterium]|nr:malate synthase A [Candidatus Obscuribacterales bacterium]